MFTKIKHNKGQTELAWTDERLSGETVEHKLTATDTPRPEFIEALQSLKVHVLDVCELPKEYGESMTIIGVSISENESQGRGIVVTAVKKVSGANAPVILNTPHVPEESEHGPTLSRSALDALNRLEEEATAYRQGQRAQQDMFATKEAA